MGGSGVAAVVAVDNNAVDNAVAVVVAMDNALTVALIVAFDNALGVAMGMSVESWPL